MIGIFLDRIITITKYQDDKISAEELFNNFKEDQKILL